MHYSDFIHPTITIISDASYEYLVPLSLPMLQPALLNERTNKKAAFFHRVFLVIYYKVFEKVSIEGIEVAFQGWVGLFF